MRSWDEISEFYVEYAHRKDSRDIDFGNGMLDLIHVLRNDPDINPMSLGTRMNWLVVAWPDNRFPAVHIQLKWATPHTYDVFLAPKGENDIPDVTTITLSEAVVKVKEYLHI